jgi:hypothetical protein
MGGLRLRRLAAAANVSYLVDICVFLIKGRLRCRSRCGKNSRARLQDVALLTSAYGVRRDKAALSSGCKSHPANAPAGSSRSSYGGDEIAEAFG